MYTALWLEDNCFDIPPFAKSVCDVLNVTVIFAKTFSEANAIMRKQPIDVILLDIEIAGEHLTGVEYAHQLRASRQYYQTPIVFVSYYSHLSRHLFATVQHCQMLSKPYTQDELLLKLGGALGIYEYSFDRYTDTMLLIPIKRERTVEVNARTICYMEFLKNNIVYIQFNHGGSMTLECQRNVRKSILEQIEQNGVTHLVQIYRSIIVNVHAIKIVKQNGHEGNVYLFGEKVPKPLGAKYLDNVKNFL